MLKHRHARGAVLALIVLAVAFLWAADQGIRAAALGRAAKSATASSGTEKAVTGKTAKAATPARTTRTAVTKPATSPKPATMAAAAPQGGKGKVTRDDLLKKAGKTTVTEQKAAAKRAAARGMKPGVAGLPAGLIGTAAVPGYPYADPGGVPHYFGPYGNWAFSPLPSFPILSVTMDAPGTGYTAPVVTITDVYGTGTATATATVVAGAITAITVDPGSLGFHVPFVTITDLTGTGAAATAVLDIATPVGGMRKFIDSLPQLGPGGANTLIQAHGAGQYLPVGVAEPCTYSGQAADCYTIGLVEYTEQMHRDLPPTRLRGYVQLSTTGVPLTNPDGSPILMPNGTQAMGVDRPHYLGPIIVAQGRAHGVAGLAGEPKPVRVTFYNLLPIGSTGDLFIPVDETIPGAGQGPAGPGGANDKYKQNRATIHLHGNNTVWLSDGNTHQWITPAHETTPYPAGASARSVPDMPGCDAGGRFADNNVLPGSGGCMTFFYTNAQSARLQFYHDHAHGITRLNVYAGEAAGYVLTDAVEQDMINGTNISGVNIGPGATTPFLKVLPGLGIPLVIQDRTFVDETTVWAQDPTWNSGTGLRDAAGKLTQAIRGDLWYPHVYMTVQNPWDLTGTNGLGRWHYGPWFNPPVPDCNSNPAPGCIEVGVVPNEHAVPGSPGYSPLEPPMRPGVPNPSLPGESFLDTPIVNGTAYPYVEVPAGPVRFRVLNASNDRFLNLQLYLAADKTTWLPASGTSDPNDLIPYVPGSPTTVCAAGANPLNCTEVKMVPIEVAPANQLADTPSGVPDPTTAGPAWWLIGTEGGFMPKPVVVPSVPAGWNLDMAYFAFGIINQHSLFLGAAERADVVADFSAYAGRTLILYNDSPAPVPAGAAPYDFFTGNGDQVDGGGAPDTQPGYGPNTRTIMQIRVTGPAGQTPDVTLANLEAVFAKTATKPGVFETTQDPIIVPQAAYNTAYNNTFPSTAAEQFLQIADTQKTFQPINGAGVPQPAVTIPLEMKAMHDEMGGVYDTMFGRMSGMLALVNPQSNVHLLIPYGYGAPPTDLVKGSLQGTIVGGLADGTQIWRIFHNGVDTHPIHTHLFHAQLINRVDQSGQIVGDPVDPIEHGWKDTIRINPLEVTFIAMRPTVPLPSQIPFDVPDSIRLIDPGLPEGAQLPPPAPAGWFDPLGNQLEGPATPVNHLVNFGWEYVWHCHILSHEEMDMMHSLVFAVPPKPATGLSATWNGNANNPRITLNWTDTSIREAGFTVERATDVDFTTGVIKLGTPGTPTVGPSAGTGLTVAYTDTTVARNSTYYYRVWANGAVVGDTFTPNFPTMSADSVSNTAGPTSTFSTALATPAAPDQPAGTVQAGPQVSLIFRDNATTETGFVVERCAGAGCATFAPIVTLGPRNNTGNVTYTDTTVAFGTSYLYRVKAFNGSASSPYSPTSTPVSVPAIPAQPASLTVGVVPANGNNYTATLTWTLAAGQPAPASFTIQRATDQDFTVGLNTSTVAGTLLTVNQTVTRNTVYYYRIQAINSAGGSSFWTKAVPFPIRTGN
jgi:FtsP/CotA-like multicopper oxidase with cupredoxin domain